MEPSLATTPFQLTDANQFFELTKDADIMREYPNMRFDSVDEARNYLEHQIDITESARINFFKAIRIVFNGLESVYTEKNNIIIGFVSLHKTGGIDRIFSGGFEDTLNYAIKSNYRCKGLMTIALNMTLDAMLQDGYNLVAANVKKYNNPSIRVLEKSGFIKVKDYPISYLYARRIRMEENEFNEVFSL